MVMTRHSSPEIADMLSDRLGNFSNSLSKNQGDQADTPHSMLAPFQKGFIYEGQKTKEQHL